MKQSFTSKRIAQCLVVLVCAVTVKQFYSAASANQLRWILAPTTALVEMVSGVSFALESHAGYISEDRSFLIAPSCAGVNFLITAFLMLCARKLLSTRSKEITWKFFPAAAAIAYLVTLIANTTRIAVALGLRQVSTDFDGMSPGQLHRFEGIVIYFGFLLLLFVVTEKRNLRPSSDLGRRLFFPLLAYYATVLGIPLATGAYRQGREFWEHSLFVLLIPLAVVLLIAAFRFCRRLLGQLPFNGHSRPASEDKSDLTAASSSIRLE